MSSQDKVQRTRAMERTLPHDLDAERSILGAILVSPETFYRATETIGPEHFFRDAHRRIFGKMVTLVDKGSVIDLVTLKDELSRSCELDEVGGPAYLAELPKGVPISANVEHYAKIVKEKARLRELIYISNRILADAYDGEEDPDQILDRAEGEILRIVEDGQKAGFVSTKDLALSGIEAVEAASNRKEFVTGVPSGFDELDEMTSGFQPSDLIIIAARPSMGKTSLAMNIATHATLKSNKVVGVFSLEMSKEQLFFRALTSEARIDSHRLRAGFLGERDWGRLSVTLGTLANSTIFIDDTSSLGVMEMRTKCRRLKAEHGLDMVIIDYIQLMHGPKTFENRNLELASISRSLKGLAKELGIPIIVLSQLSRGPETRSNHRPQLSDLRESGALEQDADVVLFVYREDVYASKEDLYNANTGIAEIIVGKQRNGPTGVVKLAFIKEFTRFENLGIGYA